jgi:hypothetical protein
MAFDAALPSNFDVAISFAGSERSLAEQLANILQAAGVIVFYDSFYPEQLWGKKSHSIPGRDIPEASEILRGFYIKGVQGEAMDESRTQKCASSRTRSQR